MNELNYNERLVICADAVNWLESSEELLTGSVFTAIPDVKDVVQFNSMKNITERAVLYRQWFTRIVHAIFKRLPDGQVAIFSQTDAKFIDTDGQVLEWIDKSHLCSTVASQHHCTLLWHKIALNGDAEVGQYRPAYTHLLCYGKRFTYHTSLFRTPDVLDRGLMTWQKATGLDSCILGIAFLCFVVHTPMVVSPFCGHGTVLSVANYFGLQALGIEISPKRARASQAKTLSHILNAMPATHFLKLGVPESAIPAASEAIESIDCEVPADGSDDEVHET